MVEFPKRQIASLIGHNGPVHCVTFSAGSGQYVLTGCADRTIRLFNPGRASNASSTGHASQSPLIQVFSAHGYEVLDIAVSSDNARFASVGGDRQVFLWDVTTGATVRRWAGHGARVNAVRLGGVGGGSGGGAVDSESVVVSASYDATVKLWDARSGSARPVQSLDEARDSVACLTVVRDSAQIVAGSTDGRVRTYDVRMGTLHTDCVGAPVTSVEVTRDGEAMLVGSLDSHVRLFDRRDGRCLKAYAGLRNESYRIRSCLGLGDSVAVSGSEDGNIYAWDVLTGQIIATLEGVHAGKVTSAVSWNGRKKEWASAGSDGKVIVWGV